MSKPNPALKFRSSTFGLALFCFILPFVTLSCPGAEFTFSGLQMATGASADGRDLAAEPLAVLALLCTIGGLMLCFVKAKPFDLAAAVTGGAGGLMLLYLKVKIEHDAMQQGNGMIQVSFNAAYWLAVVALAAGAALSIVQWQERSRSRSLATTGEATPAWPPAA